MMRHRASSRWSPRPPCVFLTPFYVIQGPFMSELNIISYTFHKHYREVQGTGSSIFEEFFVRVNNLLIICRMFLQCYMTRVFVYRNSIYIV